MPLCLLLLAVSGSATGMACSGGGDTPTSEDAATDAAAPSSGTDGPVSHEGSPSEDGSPTGDGRVEAADDSAVRLEAGPPPSDGASPNCPRGTSYPDGCPGAPTPPGAIQYPTLLSTYGPNRPPWNVAGVDYYVGMPQGQALKDWRTLQTAPPTGLVWDSRGYLRCNSGNPVLDGYDFTTGTTSWSIYVPSGGCTGLTIENSKMGCVPGATTGQNAPAFGGFNIQSSPIAFTFKNNTVDYAGCQGSGGAGNGFIDIGNLGCTDCSIDVEYNYIRDLYDTFLGFGGSYTSFVDRYNVIENPATSAPGDPAMIHMNSLSGLASGTVSPVFTFNTTFASQSYAGGELPQFYYNGGGTMDSPTVTNNTFPFSACGCVSYKVHGNTGYSGPATSLTGTPVVGQNYFDTTDSYGPFYPGSFGGWTSSGNIDMNTGATITP
jgi:hypothetical protein